MLDYSQEYFHLDARQPALLAHNDKFVEVGSSLPRLCWTPLPIEEFPPMFHISIEETEKALLATKLHSSPGPDEIAAWFLRECACALCRPLCPIFNASVREGVFPSLWKSANVIPVPKTTPALYNVDSDFRPISLTPIVNKVLESFIYKWLLQSILNKIDPLQFGSLKGSSTTMALLVLVPEVVGSDWQRRNNLAYLWLFEGVWSHRSQYRAKQTVTNGDSSRSYRLDCQLLNYL